MWSSWFVIKGKRSHLSLTCILKNAGVSIKIVVASRFESSNWLYEQGAIVPLLWGGDWASSAPENLTFQSPEMRFSAFWGLNLWTKERVFHSRKCSFQIIYQSHNQFLQAMNKIMMKTKLCTFACKQIVGKPINILVKKWLKYGVHMTKA